MRPLTGPFPSKACIDPGVDAAEPCTDPGAGRKEARLRLSPEGSALRVEGAGRKEARLRLYPEGSTLRVDPVNRVPLIDDGKGDQRQGHCDDEIKPQGLCRTRD